MSDDDAIGEVLEMTQQLLESIMRSDWESYATLCDPTISCFEPESMGHLVEGMEFHRFYFSQDGGDPGRYNVTIVSPHVRLLGDTAVVSYVRLVQRLDAQGNPVVRQSQETRVWQRQEGVWRHVHFHRSLVG